MAIDGAKFGLIYSLISIDLRRGSLAHVLSRDADNLTVDVGEHNSVVMLQWMWWTWMQQVMSEIYTIISID